MQKFYNSAVETVMTDLFWKLKSSILQVLAESLNSGAFLYLSPNFCSFYFWLLDSAVILQPEVGTSYLDAEYLDELKDF